MFGNDKGKAARTGGLETLIGPRVVIRGDVAFSGGLYIEGRVHGSVTADDEGQAVVTISDGGLVEGEVRAPCVIVNGELRGDVYATERIELTANARVQGNIYYKVVEMAAGAMITGRLIHGEEPQRQLPKPEVLKQVKDAAA
ncbi:MAG TPA: polymer-forming cytoskeletal protein [Xanthomonadaceae bacterium]|nr:polymer-forming cytoskeletal protein [Xanthomonadaceae bacterium]